MSRPTKILITGAAGNLGQKLVDHLQGRFSLCLLDKKTIESRPEIEQVDLSDWDKSWVDRFQGIDVVVHLAGDPMAKQTWPNLLAPNVDALINVFQAAVQQGVQRLIYASSNHVMGGYKDRPDPWKLTPHLPPLPGAQYITDGEPRDSTPYASAKLFGERLGAQLSQSTPLSVIAIRLGWTPPGDNLVSAIPANRDPWFRQMWLSNRDYQQLMEKAILADPSIRFALVHGMSSNTGMRWDLTDTCEILGYHPQDNCNI